MPELKPLKTSPKKRAAIRRGTNQIIEMDDGLCGMTQDALDMLDDLETVDGREKLLVDIVRTLRKAHIHCVEYDGELGYPDSRCNTCKAADDLLAQFDAEEHQ